jgi:hypothetical protein
MYDRSRVAGPKELEEPALVGEDATSAPATAIMPVGPRNKPVTDPTAVLPSGQSFEVHAASTPRSAKSGHTRADGRPPLDFTKHRNIDRFELIRELARGGMGQVFLARDTKLGRKVAIKFLLHDDPDFVQRFLVEARATARCTHENIVTIYEVGEHEGLPYMVLEYLEGRTLSDVLDAQPSLMQFTELMVPVVRALERAHEHGIVHRDLKPSNIFVTDRGQVKVLDFGVARMMDRAAGIESDGVPARALRLANADSSVTFTGNDSLVGTLPYMSPEQWGADVVDHQSDIWAVGIMFWRALTNVHPAGSTAPDKLKARLCDLATPLPSISERDPKIPGALADVIDRCLRKRKDERYQNASELLAGLQAFLSPASRSEDTCPYRGLAAFGENDAKFFFGRSNEIRTALGQLEAWPMLAVIGPSGVGKSSFVHAGLVPAVRASGGSWKVHVLRPGKVPLHRLANLLEDALGTNEPSGDLIGQLRDSPGVFGAILRKAVVKSGKRVLVVVDQLEELFTLCDSDPIRASFLAALLAAADDPTSPVRVVLSMRADFLDRLAGHKQFLGELSRGLFFLTAPDLDNLRETLIRPAELAGYTFEDTSIVDDMLHVASSRGALPLLSFAASKLWDARDRGKKMFSLAAYKQMGGIGGAFAGHADQVAAAVPPQQQILLRAILTRLVTPDGTRAVVDHHELISLAAPEEVERILDQLVRARLINLMNEPDQAATVEIVHEMLITEWPTLRRWLEDSQALRGFLHELRQAARQWAARGKPNDLVWRGATAQDALGTTKRHVLDLSANEQEFLAAVRALMSRTRKIRFVVFASIFTALVVVIALGSVALIRIRDAEHEAQDKAVAAERAAEVARTARAQVQAQLDEVRAAEAAKAKAEEEQKAAVVKVQQAEGEVTESREELQKSNAALKQALTATEAQKRTAETNAETARKATDEAKKATATAQKLLEEQQARVKELEARMHEIYSGDLMKKK